MSDIVKDLNTKRELSITLTKQSDELEKVKNAKKSLIKFNAK